MNILLPNKSSAGTTDECGFQPDVAIWMKDNSSTIVSEDVKNTLIPFAGKTLKRLQEQYPELLVFPGNLGEYEDDIENSVLFQLYGNENKLQTGNVVGFFGIGPVHFQIRSRFDEDTPAQFFLHHMLHRVFCATMLRLPTHPDREPIWDFMLYLFPFALKRAVRRGVFRTYREFQRNDDHLRGAIDIPRHIRCNIPFNGKVACRVREYSGNNLLNHLIRHAIEVLRRNQVCSGILNIDHEFRDAVRTIVELTPDYCRQDEAWVISNNLRSIRHPFYTEYTLLQTICLKILRQEKNTYGKMDGLLNGIVFRAEWLWEEYLASILTDPRIKHAHNNTKQSPEKISIYRNGCLDVYPDFFSDQIVMDAKYKCSTIKRDDRFQIISYIHIRRAETGLLLYPDNTVSETAIRYEDNAQGLLCGGGSLGCIPFAIPKGAASFAEFQTEIGKSEEKIRKLIAGKLCD